MKSAILLLAVMAIGIGNATAQFITSHAKVVMPGQQKGIYYALPRTVIQLDFIIEETELLEGPYSDYVYMVGADNYIMEDAMEYRLADIVMTTYAEADPNATFFVEMNTKKGEATDFHLTSKGILQGVGMVVPEAMVLPKQAVDPKPASSQDKSFKYQYGSKGKSREQMAYAAADMISKIREEKIKLLTGFQETAFNLDTYRQMYADLDQMENEYLSLFIGKRIVNMVVKTVYVTPSKEVPSQTIAKFSTEDGFSTGVAGSGDVITVQALSLKTTGSINEPSQSAVETIRHENKLFYRIPEIASIKVTMGSQVLLEKRETIAQYGVFMLAPLSKTALALDPNTGQIIGMETK
jgi:hypothetical protein